MSTKAETSYQDPNVGTVHVCTDETEVVLTVIDPAGKLAHVVLQPKIAILIAGALVRAAVATES
jgi:hypothetical protein